MSISLPSLPAPINVGWRYIEFGTDLKPPLGGAQQRVGRLGSRLALDVVSQPLSADSARALIADMASARTSGATVLLTVPQEDVPPAVGTTLVNGATQSGSSLVLDGATAGVTIPKGRYFSFVAGGRNYLHLVTADATADGSGNITVNLAPMLRASPADDAAVNFVSPQIEGFLDGMTQQWTVEWLTCTSFSLSVAEIQ